MCDDSDLPRRKFDATEVRQLRGHADAALSEAAVRRFSLAEEISTFLLWLSKRWPVLGLAGLTLATMLWMDFIKAFDLPVSFVSPGALGALPVLGLAVALPVVGMMVGSALTACALWMPLYRNGPSMMGWHLSVIATEAEISDAKHAKSASPAGGSASVENDARSSPDIFNRWMTGIGFQALYWCAYVLSVSMNLHIPAAWVWGLGYSVPIFLGLFLFRPVFRAVSADRYPSWRYVGVFMFCIATQTTGCVMIILPVLSATPDGHVGLLALHLEMFVLMVVGLGLMQLFTAKLVLNGPYRGLLKHIFMLGMALLGAFALVPGIGGQVASYRLRLSGPGRSDCMVLVLRTGSAPGAALQSDIEDVAHPGQTVPLRFVTRLDDTYYVKQHPLEGPTFLIPTASVGGIKECTARP